MGGVDECGGSASVARPQSTRLSFLALCSTWLSLAQCSGQKEDCQRSGKAWPLIRRDQKEDRPGVSLVQRGSHFGSTPLGDGLVIAAGFFLSYRPPLLFQVCSPGTLCSWHSL